MGNGPSTSAAHGLLPRCPTAAEIRPAQIPEMMLALGDKSVFGYTNLRVLGACPRIRLFSLEEAAVYSLGREPQEYGPPTGGAPTGRQKPWCSQVLCRPFRALPNTSSRDPGACAPG